MKLLSVTLGALLFAAPIFSQELEALALTLQEQRSQVTQRLGPPAMVAANGDFESWQYQIGIEDHHEFSHQLLFRISTGELISFTRNYEPAVNVDGLFPEAESRVEHYPDAEHSVMVVRVRQLSGGRVLLALGSSKAGEPASQLTVIRGSDLRHFHPWLADRLHPSK